MSPQPHSEPDKIHAAFEASTSEQSCLAVGSVSGSLKRWYRQFPEEIVRVKMWAVNVTRQLSSKGCCARPGCAENVNSMQHDWFVFSALSDSPW